MVRSPNEGHRVRLKLNGETKHGPYRATVNEASTDQLKVNEASTDAKKANATRNSSSSTPRPKDVLASGTSTVCWSTRADETHRNPCGFLRVPAVSVDQSTCYPKSAMPSWSLTSYVSNIIVLPKPFFASRSSHHPPLVREPILGCW